MGMTEQELKTALAEILYRDRSGDLNQRITKVEEDIADTMALFKQAGYVQLSPDQNLPKGLTARLNLPDRGQYIYGQEALNKTGFKKVKLEVE